MGKNDIVLIASLFAAALISVIVLNIFHGKGDRVIIYVDGACVGDYSLADEVSVDIDGYDGGHNVLMISDGTAFMTDATCPDRLCMHQGRASRAGQSIVCLPNRVVVRIKGKDGSRYDAVTGQ